MLLIASVLAGLIIGGLGLVSLGVGSIGFKVWIERAGLHDPEGLVAQSEVHAELDRGRAKLTYLEVLNDHWEEGDLLPRPSCVWIGPITYEVVDSGSVRTATLSCGAWLPFVLLTPLPAFALVRPAWRRRYRRKHGLCLHCGYDLRGNVSGRCPECGSAMPDRVGEGAG